jgi:hypothetical protein
VYWFLYVPSFSQQVLIGTNSPDVGQTLPEPFILTIGDLGTAFLLGLAGGKWLTDAADKRLFKEAASEAAQKDPNQDAGNAIEGTKRGAQALNIVRTQM